MMTPPPQPEVMESTLILLVGKQIPIAPGFSVCDMADLKANSTHFSMENLPITALAGGLPTSYFDGDQSTNTYPVKADVVVGKL